jgi:hypothetical protein
LSKCEHSCIEQNNKKRDFGYDLDTKFNLQSLTLYFYFNAHKFSLVSRYASCIQALYLKESQKFKDVLKFLLRNLLIDEYIHQWFTKYSQISTYLLIPIDQLEGATNVLRLLIKTQ